LKTFHGELANGTYMLEGKAGHGKYVPATNAYARRFVFVEHIRRVGHNREMFYVCRANHILKGELNSLSSPGFCSHPIGERVFDHGIVKLVSLLGNYIFQGYIKRMEHRREIVYECETGFYLQGPSICTESQ